MNTTKPRLTKFLLILFVLLAFFIVFVMAVFYAVEDWIIHIFVCVSALFITEIWRSRTSGRSLWLCLSKKDKLLYFAGSVTVLVGILLPLKEKTLGILGICSWVLGIGLALFFTYLLGSKDLMRMLWGGFYERSKP
jgi:hypothetical protein